MTSILNGFMIAVIVIAICVSFFIGWRHLTKAADWDQQIGAEKKSLKRLLNELDLLSFIAMQVALYTAIYNFVSGNIFISDAVRKDVGLNEFTYLFLLAIAACGSGLGIVRRYVSLKTS